MPEPEAGPEAKEELRETRWPSTGASHSRLPGRLTRDNGIPGHDNPPVRAGRAGTEILIKIYFWTGTRHRTLRFFSAHDPPILKKTMFENLYKWLFPS